MIKLKGSFFVRVSIISAFCSDFASVSMYTAQECISLEIYPCDSDNELISAK